MVCHRPESLNCSIHYSFIHHPNITVHFPLCECLHWGTLTVKQVPSWCILRMLFRTRKEFNLHFLPMSYMVVLSVERHQRPVGTCKKCRVIGPDLVIHNSGDRGQCNNPKTVAHTVSYTCLAIRCRTKYWYRAVFGNRVPDNQASELSGGDVVRERNTSSVCIWDIYGHPDCIQSS